MGDGYPSEEAEMVSSLESPKANGQIISMDILGEGSCCLTVEFTNQDIGDKFQIREMGIFAQDPDKGEILYAYTKIVDPDDYDTMPGNTGNMIREVFELYTFISNITEVQVFLKPWEDASGISYNGKPVGLDATHVQGALDELKKRHDNTFYNLEYEPEPDNIPHQGDAFTGKGFLSRLLNRIAGLFLAITGKDRWYEKPAMNIEEITGALTKKVDKDELETVLAELDGDIYNKQIFEPAPDIILEDDDQFTGKGFLSRLLNRVTGLLLAITGREKWFQKPGINLEEVAATLGIKVNTDDMAEALAKKMNNPILLTENTDLNEVTEAGFYYCNQNKVASTILNTPFPDYSFTLQVEGDFRCKQTFTTCNIDNPRCYMRNVSSIATWSPWKEVVYTDYLTGKVDVGKCEVMAIPFAEAWAENSKGFYWKDEKQMVHVVMNAKKSGAINNNDFIFQLPSGYRSIFEYQSLLYDDNNLIPARFNIANNGRCQVYFVKPAGSAPTNLVFHGIFQNGLHSDTVLG